ncbi:MAG TPA: thrombospondin type 3 repeat-containing protein, partial [Steroidobacteraceae bacterium]|nr:thrombospondin type 3 repeat-containing protein [Steroidobacteraceae bacterium]
IYTGLMYMEPYIVPSKSKLPLLHGRTLQLEVVVRELDENSITFPPVALTTKREREGVYIELLLEDLMRDSDGDGLTDLLEDKLRTDPNNPDTDGDGLDDGIDPLPQVSVKAAPHRNAEVISMALQRVLGFDRAAIKIGAPPSNDKSSAIESMFGALHRGGGDRNVLFLKADPELFNGLMLPARVIIVNDHDIEQLRARYGVFYPLQFSPWFNRNGDKAVLRWSAGWVGGTLLFTKGNDGWECKEVSNWIT